MKTTEEILETLGAAEPADLEAAAKFALRNLHDENEEVAKLSRAYLQVVSC